MTDLDSHLYLIGGEILVILGITIAMLNNKRQKRTLSGIFLLILGFMLAHTVTHLLPNAVAGFIFRSYHYATPRNLWIDQL
ncbi:MAG: hypothetical protein Q7U98_05760 [Methylicorpusculum sp.]|uniref:hypothetical protein n=1 Tax=Methylicorpusculum sp. TaxID=2713644 RepID=UPI0027268870|nr:hypothetical protein [Methylicorpusculum sp.]MDO8843279.1 hypothetical protein [Methylicorpusculum sp.]MDO8938645.1 hypothetical protein [Methylicorpusculum sp.]MDO9240277.1 hypothetical protein [Methylicorpusculum sp.]MDP2179238.1 hypothetical protein [Methylicorpusculum sp.]MDP2204323.1 hypothetical protein [Methylicorpusculum sp.]